MTNATTINVGDEVLFGRSSGEQTKGTVVRKNPRPVKIMQSEVRGTQKTHPVGTVWKVPYSMVSPVSKAAHVADTLGSDDSLHAWIQRRLAKGLPGDRFIETELLALAAKSKALAALAG